MFVRQGRRLGVSVVSLDVVSVPAAVASASVLEEARVVLIGIVVVAVSRRLRRHFWRIGWASGCGLLRRSGEVVMKGL